MPLEARPLFRPDVLRAYLTKFTLPGRIEPARAKLSQWAAMLVGGGADDLNERELLPDFITDVFVGLLGYEAPPGREGQYNLSREQHVEVEGQFADAALGRFTATQRQFVTVVEGKGPKDPLERPHAGRRMSAVDQGYKYAVNLPCDWIILTNIHQVRLYYKGTDQQTYERFDTEQLATNEALLKKLVFLLGAERLLPPEGRSHLYDLLAASERAGRELTRDYYRSFAELREQAFHRIAAANPTADRHAVLSATQKILDRVLFCAFCEDRGLLPALTIQKAYQHADPYNPRPIWDNFRGLFNAVNRGNERLAIPRYNGGLFADDPALDALTVPDDACTLFQTLGDYDYRPPAEAAIDIAADNQAIHSPLIDVDILGHIFEQSISDLERLRSELNGVELPPEAKSARTRRKREGAFYTPSFITRYIVEQALGGVLRDRFQALRQRHEAEAVKPLRPLLADPNSYDTAALRPAGRETLTRFWEAWQKELGTIRLLDPACGSGAFLVEAFDQLYAAYETANDRLADLRGHRTLFDLDRQILQNNLYGVDLNDEAVEICKLSMWIKTAQRGKELTSLDTTVRAGNSVVDDPAVHHRAFDWKAAFPEVFAVGGFDVVVGNPPYVRQELLSAIKPHLQQRFASYHGMADLYVYFYELGLRLLKPGGKLSLVVTNKWLKAGYAEPLRKHLAEQSWVESLVDFGHAKQIFEDADVFPCILVAQKPVPGAEPPTPRGTVIPREQLRIDDLTRQIEAEGYAVDRSRFGADAWQLEPPAVMRLLAKIRRNRPALAKLIGSSPLVGIKTGCNEAFLIDTGTRNRLIADDPRCEPVIKPYIRGEDIERWHSNWAGVWMIAVKSSLNEPWPWAESGNDAEHVFQRTYPSLHAHMKLHEPTLKKRQDHGRYWWELRSCKYWEQFDRPKLTYQEIQFHCWYGLSPAGTCGNNKTYILPTDDVWLLAVLNSPLMWWHNWRYLPHMKDEAMFPAAFLMENLPIAEPTADQRSASDQAVGRLIQITKQRQEATRTLLDWLKVEFDVVKPTLKLQAPAGLDADAFVVEVKKARRKGKMLTAAALNALRNEYSGALGLVRTEAAEALTLEHRLSDLVNAAYGLTPDDIALMWQTAPPRMPLDARRTASGAEGCELASDQPTDHPSRPTNSQAQEPETLRSRKTC